MDNQRVIDTLNNLLETTGDGMRGFVACAEGVQNTRLKAVFRNRRAAVRGGGCGIGR